MGVGGIREQQELAALQRKVCRELSTIPRWVKAVTSPARTQDAEWQARVKTGLRDSAQGQTESSGHPAGLQ